MLLKLGVATAEEEEGMAEGDTVEEGMEEVTATMVEVITMDPSRWILFRFWVYFL